jgi:UDP-N-acetylglucosamine 2-epimerase (non-hydrolysing)
VSKMLYLVGGARPNFMKLAPLVRALDRRAALDYRIVHTGQHYDRDMSDVFFAELGIPAPDYQLGAGGGTHAQQTAKIMVSMEELCLRSPPGAVVVVGDVNSTLACSIVAKKLHIPVAHIESGLRSGDMTMPEEINRIVTDAIADWLFVTEPSGVENLRREGRLESAVFLVGNVMVDNLFYQRDCLSATQPAEGVAGEFRRRHLRYGVVTLHRPSNVDDPVVLRRLAGALSRLAETLPLIFPVHPRTRASLEAAGVEMGSGLTLCPPLGYMQFLSLWKDAAVVLTDSGGLQEETTALGVPCVTLRDSTERPITVTEGTNVVVGTDMEAMLAEADKILRGHGKVGRRPDLWDGRAAERIAEILEQLLLEPGLDRHRTAADQGHAGPG